ncbi:MAG TPA: type IV pilus biogenesis/stability protein PilW [Chromatiales bacterium]|nr:type IV pilus biogenesis/stability protein PilW [Thiotrichales bacterium]HIP68811.1 type IV pilus biogenesis/stability protein PilW [Chromatiales bacterium]
MRKCFVLLFFILLQSCATDGTSPVGPDRDRLSQQQLQQALGHFRNRQLPEAQLAVADSLKSNPNNAQAHHVAGLIYQRLGQTSQARDHFESAIKLAPNEPIIRNNFGNFLCSLGKYNAADENFSLAAKQPDNPKPEIAYTNAGLCALRAKSSEKAKRYFEQAMQANPGQLTALYQLARLNFNAGKPLAASSYLEQYSNHSQDTAKTLLLRAQIEQALGNLESMEIYRQQLRSKFPNSPEVRKANALVATRSAQTVTATEKPSPSHTDTDWLLSRQPNHYTLQILATANRQAISQLLTDNPLPDRSAEYSFNNNGTQWFNLVMGDYANLESARSAMRKLPESVRALNPWVRRFNSIQRVISQKGF